MNNKLSLGLIILALLAGALIAYFFIAPHTVEIETKVVYITQECENSSQNASNEQISVSAREIVREYYDEIIEERQEELAEYKETGFPEIRPMNYVPYCERARVSC